jgi:hypothetical protein
MEQAVLVMFPLSDGEFGSPKELQILDSLGADLADVIAESGVGEFDGKDVGEGCYRFYLYGPDADALFDAIEPLLLRETWPRQVSAVKRYGPPGAPKVNIVIGELA